MPSSLFRHLVRVTQFPGQVAEQVHEGVRASLQPEFCYFPLEPRLRVGDRLEADYFDEPMFVLSVKRNELPGSSASHQQVTVGTNTELHSHQHPLPTNSLTTQIFHGSVGVVAGRDHVPGNNVALPAHAAESALPSTASGKVFISHAAADKALVDALVDCLRLGIPGLTHDMIFCTSLEGMGIPEGEDFAAFIKHQLQSPPLVILLITPNYYDSLFCLCELGAAWAMSHGSFPILVPPLRYEDLKAVLSQTQARHLDAAGLNALRDRLVEAMSLGSTATRSTTMWEEKRNALLDEVPRLLESLKPTGRVPREEYLSALERVKDLELQVQTERNTSQLRARELEVIAELKDKKEVDAAKQAIGAPAEKSIDTAIATFRQLCAVTRQELRKLPPIAQQSLYQYFAGGTLFISSDWSNDAKRGEATEAAERDFVTFEDSQVRTNPTDPLTMKIIARLDEVFALVSDGPVELVNWIREEYLVNPAPENRRFWEELLGLSK